jgi:hypothetical protein
MGAGAHQQASLAGGGHRQTTTQERPHREPACDGKQRAPVCVGGALLHRHPSPAIGGVPQGVCCQTGGNRPAPPLGWLAGRGTTSWPPGCLNGPVRRSILQCPFPDRWPRRAGPQPSTQPAASSSKCPAGLDAMPSARKTEDIRPPGAQEVPVPQRLLAAASAHGGPLGRIGEGDSRIRAVGLGPCSYRGIVRPGRRPPPRQLNKPAHPELPPA